MNRKDGTFSILRLTSLTLLFLGVLAKTIEALGQSSSPQLSPTLIASPSATPVSKEQFISPQMVSAVASLWQLALILLGVVSLIVFRKQIRRVFDLLLSKLESAESVDLTLGKVGASLKSAAREAAKEAIAEEIAKEEQKEAEAETAPGKAEPRKPEQPRTPGESARALLDAMRAQNREEVERLHREMQEGETDDVRHLKNEALYLYALFMLGDRLALGKLEQLSKENESFAEPFWWLGHCYQYGHELLRAADAFKLAADKESDDIRRANYVINAAECLFEFGRHNQAEEIIGSELKISANSEATFALLSALASFYDRSNQHESRALALDLSLRFFPNDSNTMFNAAYAYGEAGLEGMSLFHYRNLLDFEPDNASALNNAGVQYDRLGMPWLSTTAYKAAEKLNNSLASANLASKYVNAGFVEEATTSLSKAKEMMDVHPNVLTALSNLPEKQEREHKLTTEIMDNSVRQQEFLRLFANKYLIPQENRLGLAGDWILFADVQVHIDISEESIEAHWVLNNKKYRFEGTAKKGGAKITFYRMNYGIWSPDVELGFEKEADAYAYLSDDEQTIEIMKLKNQKHEFLKLERAKTEMHVEPVPAEDRQ